MLLRPAISFSFLPTDPTFLEQRDAGSKKRQEKSAGKVQKPGSARPGKKEALDDFPRVIRRCKRQCICFMQSPASNRRLLYCSSAFDRLIRGFLQKPRVREPLRPNPRRQLRQFPSSSALPTQLGGLYARRDSPSAAISHFAPDRTSSPRHTSKQTGSSHSFPVASDDENTQHPSDTLSCASDSL